MAKIIIGCFGSAHGVRGSIRVHSYTDPAKNILKYMPWQLRLTPKGEWQTIDIAKTSWHNDQLVVQIAGITDRDEAKRYTNLEIAVERDQLPDLKEDEHYWADLIGYTVVNSKDEELGVLDDFIETGSNDVMIVKSDQEHLIPYIDDVVTNIDHKKRIITVDWECIL